MPVATVWALSQEWYAGRLERNFRPRSRDASQALLRAVGLTEEFWLLG